MRLGELLVARGIVAGADIDEALVRQRRHGGRLGTHLIAMGVLNQRALLTVISDQRDIGGAIDLCEHALRRLVAVHGNEHAQTNRARCTLSRALFAAGRAQDAVDHVETARAALIKTLGFSHPWTKDAITHAYEVRATLHRASNDGATSSVAHTST